MTDALSLLDDLIRREPNVVAYSRAMSMGTLGSGRYAGNGFLVLKESGIEFIFNKQSPISAGWKQITEVYSKEESPQFVAIRIDGQTFQFRVESDSLGRQINELWKVDEEQS